WVGTDAASYQTALELSAKDRDALALDVTMTLSTAKVKVDSFSARSLPDGYAAISIVLQVKDKSELAAVITKLGQISGVYQVKRATG
ncbi:MAG: ACT domain-containing protein, partial [Pseudoflavonifractor sp.]